MYLRHGLRRPNFVPKFGASVMGIGPYGETGKASATTRASGAQRSVCAAVARDGQESRQRSSPKGSATPDNPSVSLTADSSLYTREPLGTGDADRRVGPAGLLAMAMVFCHSEERSDVGIRPFYDERGFGPMYLGHGFRRPNFVPKFGASVMGIGPYALRGTARRVVVPYGWVRGASSTARGEPARSEASAPAAARDGRESAQEPSQKEDRPRDHSGSA